MAERDTGTHLSNGLAAYSGKASTSAANKAALLTNNINNIEMVQNTNFSLIELMR